MKNIDWVKAAIIFSMAAVVMLLIQRYDQFQTKRFDERQQARQVEAIVNSGEDIATGNDIATQSTTAAAVDNDFAGVEAPAAPSKVINADVEGAASQIETSKALIKVETDLVKAQIDPQGGDIVNLQLLKYKMKLKSKEPIELLNNRPGTRYIAESGLIGADGIDRNSRPLYQSASYDYRSSDEDVIVDLTITVNGVNIIKRYIFKNDDYLIDLEYIIDNQSNSPVSMDLLAQIKRTGYIPEGRDLGMAAFVGSAITTPEERYLRHDFKDMDSLSKPFNETVDNGWVAMVQRYFVSAWVADKSKPIKYNIRPSTNLDYYLMGYTQQGVKLDANEKGTIRASFFSGPKDQYRLRDIGDNLDLTVDYGWLWWAAQPLYAVLNFIYTGTFNAFGLNTKIFSGIPNWGVAIILLTIFVKLVFFKLSATSFRSMARMRKLQPQMMALKERYGDDRQKMSQETMKLYKKEKVNPMSGCLPMLVQMPIFLALYWVFLESVELRHAPFFGWIQDLSAKDPLFILPLLYGASMFIQFKFQPTPTTDPMQAKVMQFMPLMFTIIFLWFPSGLVLYWTVNNIITIAHQWWVMRHLE